MLKEYIEKNRGLNNFNTSDVLDIIVNHIDQKNDDCDCCCVIKAIHEKLHGKHFDEDSAISTVSKMHYIKAGTTAKTYGAFVTLEQSNKIFSRYKDEISKSYNNYDFYVAINMIYSDNYNLYHKWFKDVTEEQLINIVTEATINWFNDSDSPYSDDTKIWSYIKH